MGETRRFGGHIFAKFHEFFEKLDNILAYAVELGRMNLGLPTHLSSGKCKLLSTLIAGWLQCDVTETTLPLSQVSQ